MNKKKFSEKNSFFAINKYECEQAYRGWITGGLRHELKGKEIVLDISKLCFREAEIDDNHTIKVSSNASVNIPECEEDKIGRYQIEFEDDVYYLVKIDSEIR